MFLCHFCHCRIFLTHSCHCGHVQNANLHFHFGSSDCIDALVPIIHSKPVNPPITMADIPNVHTAEADVGALSVAAATLKETDTHTDNYAHPPVSSPAIPKKRGKKQASASPSTPSMITRSQKTTNKSSAGESSN